ncbi:MAG: hypothetical protein JO250_23825 [Armatimonadetes bacterium]|nr:hypothetical protein [Armatimonadota bacterium]
MTLTLDLSPEQESRLRAQAAAHGQAADQYAVSLLDGALNTSAAEQRPFYEIATKEEWLAAFGAWTASLDPNTPVLLNDSREVIYED